MPRDGQDSSRGAPKPRGTMAADVEEDSRRKQRLERFGADVPRALLSLCPQSSPCTHPLERPHLLCTVTGIGLGGEGVLWERG